MIELIVAFIGVFIGMFIGVLFVVFVDKSERAVLEGKLKAIQGKFKKWLLGLRRSVTESETDKFLRALYTLRVQPQKKEKGNDK